MQSTGLIVEWRPDEPFEDDDDPDYVYTPETMMRVMKTNYINGTTSVRMR
jgi:hypothetical protein